MLRFEVYKTRFGIGCLALCLFGCSQPPTRTSSNVDKKDVATPDRIKNSNPSVVTPKGQEKKDPAQKVKNFSFKSPSPDWGESEKAKGDGTFTQAGFKMNSKSIQLLVTTIGIPASGEEARELVKKCETEFAQGSANHSDMAKAWIVSGFSISRYANQEQRSVSAWCCSDLCKVQLKLTFGPDSNFAESIKLADATINDFFEKNPNGGAKTN